MLTHTFFSKDLGGGTHAVLVEFDVHAREEEAMQATGELLQELVGGKAGLVILDPESGAVARNGSLDLTNVLYEHARSKMNGEKGVVVLTADHFRGAKSALSLIPGVRNGNFRHTNTKTTASVEKLIQFRNRQPNCADYVSVIFFSSGSTLRACSEEDIAASLCSWGEKGVSHVFITDGAIQQWMSGVAKNVVLGDVSNVSDACEAAADENPIRVLGSVISRCTVIVPTVHLVSGRCCEVGVSSAHRNFAQKLFGRPVPLPENEFVASIVASERVLYASNGVLSSNNTTVRLKVCKNNTRVLLVCSGDATVHGSDDTTDPDKSWEHVPLGIPGLVSVGVHDEDLPVGEAACRLLGCDANPAPKVVQQHEGGMAAAATSLIEHDTHAQLAWASSWVTTCAASQKWDINPKSEWLAMFRVLLNAIIGRSTLHHQPTCPIMLRESSAPVEHNSFGTAYY